MSTTLESVIARSEHSRRLHEQIAEEVLAIGPGVAAEDNGAIRGKGGAA